MAEGVKIGAKLVGHQSQQLLSGVLIYSAIVSTSCLMGLGSHKSVTTSPQRWRGRAAVGVHELYGTMVLALHFRAGQTTRNNVRLNANNHRDTFLVIGLLGSYAECSFLDWAMDVSLTMVCFK